MLSTNIFSSSFVILTVILACRIQNTTGAFRRCYVCRSRGELGSCKDPFLFNATTVEHERGVSSSPCTSGWCVKIVETENDVKEEYAVATQRFCLQRGPPDNEDRCDYTKWKNRRVFMCYCRGDLCNSSVIVKPASYFITCMLVALCLLLRRS